MGRRKPRIKENVEVIDIAEKGRGLGRDETGKVIFIENVVPGDIVDVKISKSKKEYFQGFPIKFHTYSPIRVTPHCDHFEICGGCQYQFMNYKDQLRYKEGLVRNALSRIGKVPIGKFNPIIASEKTALYRNKLEYTFANKKWLTREEIDSGTTNEVNVLGYHKSGAFDKILDIKYCHHQAEPSNAIRNFLRDKGNEMGLEFFDYRTGNGFLRHAMIRITSIGEIMVVLSFYRESEADRKAYLDALKDAFPQITSIYYCINGKKNDFMLDLDMILYSGAAKISEYLGEVEFQIGPKSFFQTNSLQAKVLFDVVKSYTGLKGHENVYDLYTGLGSIALYIADHCKQVVGIEEVESAIEDAHFNMQLNNIDNAIFYAGDVKNILTRDFQKTHGAPDVIITDPPRMGMHPKVVDMLLELECPKIIYVSCNPATQARDLNLLAAKYSVDEVQPVDMFPQTHHVENVALLSLL